MPPLPHLHSYETHAYVLFSPVGEHDSEFKPMQGSG